MSNKQQPNNPNNTNAKQTRNGENEKRLNQVPNSKNPKVPGNEAPYRWHFIDTLNKSWENEKNNLRVKKMAKNKNNKTKSSKKKSQNLGDQNNMAKGAGQNQTQGPK